MGWWDSLLSGLGNAAGSAGDWLGNLFGGGGGGADIGSANPATFQDGGMGGGAVASPSADYSTGAGISGAEAPQASQGLPQQNPMVESQKTPGNWWETLGKNAVKQVQDNPWKAAGYGAMGAGMLGNAIMAGNQAPPGGGLPGRGMAQPMRSTYQPNPATNTPADPSLPPAGDYNSPLLRNQNQNGMNVRRA